MSFVRIVSLSLACLFFCGCAKYVEAETLAGWSNSPPQGLRVVTIGTGGGPPPRSGRGQPATLIQVDGRNYLVDAGDGTGFALRQAGILPNSLNSIFVTHLHWDHVLGLDYILGTDWMSGRTKSISIYGPQGLDFFMSRLLSMMHVGEDIFAVQADERPSLNSLFLSREIGSCEETEVYKDDWVTVSTVCTSHFDRVFSEDHSYGVDRAMAYRFDTKYGSITVTGDTGPSESVEKLASNSDILVAEIVDVQSMGNLLKMIQPDADHAVLLSHMEHQHLTAREVGVMASTSNVRQVILSHLIFGPGFDPSDFAIQVKQGFDGEVLIGEDLMSFEIPPEE